MRTKLEIKFCHPYLTFDYTKLDEQCRPFSFLGQISSLKLQEIERNKSKVRAANSIFRNGPRNLKICQFYHLLKLLSNLESSCEKVYKAGYFKGPNCPFRE